MFDSRRLLLKNLQNRMTGIGTCGDSPAIAHKQHHKYAAQFLYPPHSGFRRISCAMLRRSAAVQGTDTSVQIKRQKAFWNFTGHAQSPLRAVFHCSLMCEPVAIVREQKTQIENI